MEFIETLLLSNKVVLMSYLTFSSIAENKQGEEEKNS